MAENPCKNDYGTGQDRKVMAAMRDDEERILNGDEAAMCFKN
jgi:hypothetical protein